MFIKKTLSVWFIRRFCQYEKHVRIEIYLVFSFFLIFLGFHQISGMLNVMQTNEVTRNAGCSSCDIRYISFQAVMRTNDLPRCGRLQVTRWYGQAPKLSPWSVGICMQTVTEMRFLRGTSSHRFKKNANDTVLTEDATSHAAPDE